MLNIAKHKVKIDETPYKSFNKVAFPNAGKTLSRFLYGFALFAIIVLFLPWTQNINSTGNVTTLYLDQRPQSIETAIAGRIEKWYVREGEYVNKGDTILHLSEIKDEYLDPLVVERTITQKEAKASAVESYKQKVNALENQIIALSQNLDLKLEQATNKITAAKLKMIADSIDYNAAIVNFEIADSQLIRQQKLFDQGLKSLTDLEKRKTKFQLATAKKIETESKWISSQNEYLNAQIEYNAITSQFADKLAKANSEKYESLSKQFKVEEELSKLENKISNLENRVVYRFVLAPQNGFVTKATSRGIGETVKEGEELITIVPSNQNLATELYVRPVDLPLISLGESARIIFDGWPVIVFSGWPNVSFGTFGGVVVGIDNVTSKNGKYRILVAPDPNDEPWPKLLRVGSGVRAFALLNEVPVWYELWRQLNGFPPDFYVGENGNDGSLKNKKGIEK